MLNARMKALAEPTRPKRKRKAGRPRKSEHTENTVRDRILDSAEHVFAEKGVNGAGLREIAKRGGDYRAIWEQAKRERAEAKALGLAFDLSGTNAPDSTIGADPTPDATPKPKQDATND